MTSHMDDTASLDATALADLVRTKQVKPSELLESAISRAERVNPTVNAIVAPMFDLARDTANGPIDRSAPFCGVPFLLKDLTAEYAGVPITSGSEFLKDFVPDEDSELTKRYKAAGLNIFGKTNTPEFGLIPTTEPALFGPTRNPWNTELTAGGSSGGSAAAVASRIVPMAHGNDGGGSIRIPSSCCGLFGLKPTRGRNPFRRLGLLSQDHALTRTVRDSAALLDATEGPRPGDPYHTTPKARPYIEEVGADPGRLRIAFTTKTPAGGPLHDDCVAAVRDAAALCRDLGHEVIEASPQVDVSAFGQSFMIVWAGGCADTIESWNKRTGRTIRQELFEPLTWALYQIGKLVTAASYLAAVADFDLLARGLAEFFESQDIWLTSTLGEPPVPLGTFDAPAGNPLEGFGRAGQFTPCTGVFNATGQPAMSVPLHWNDEGIPIWAQFVAPFGDEATLFRLAAQLEEVRPWAEMRPAVSA
jgi:amidase